MGKAGFNDDALIDIARIECDDLSVAPAAPAAGQIAVYAKSGTVKKQNSSGTELTVGPQVASEIPVAISTSDNALVGSDVQSILNKYYGPTNSEKATYLANGELDFVEFFNGPSQITANRIAKVTFSYDGNLNPTSEVLLLYDTNGTTVLKTVTFTHTFVSSNYSTTTQVTS